MKSIYAEAAAVQRLLEEALCCLSPEDADLVAREVLRYVATDGAWTRGTTVASAKPACEILAESICYHDDAIENLTRHLNKADYVGHINPLDALLALRMASAERIAAMQPALPGIQLAINWLLAVLCLGSFPLIRVVESGALAAGQSPFNMEAILFGSLTGTVVLALVIIDDIAEPDRGLYSVNGVREVLRSALKAQAQSVLLPTNGGAAAAQAGVGGNGDRAAGEAQRREATHSSNN